MEKSTNFYITEENISKRKNKTNFRGYLQSSDSVYYILNELFTTDNMKLFSAVKLQVGGNSKNVENQKFCVRYLPKEWFKEKIFKKLQIHDDRIKKFFDSLKKKFESFKKIINPNIQELKDYIEDEDGIYIVFEYCEYTLKDYLQIMREPIKFTRFPFEVKVRKIIYQIIDTIYFVQSEVMSMCFGGVLNSDDIMISESVDSRTGASNNCVVKFPHPFLLDIMTILKIYNSESFPSFYAPEIYSLFESDGITKEIEKKDSFDLNNLSNKITHNMDIWSLGYLLYEILFEDPPFHFEDLTYALNSMNKKFYYNIYPKRISKTSLELITRCLQMDPQDRLKTDMLFEIKNKIKKENEDLEDFESNLRERMNEKRDYDLVVPFDFASLNDYENY